MEVSRGEYDTAWRSDDGTDQPRQATLDIFWLRDESLEESDNLPDPDVLAQEIVEDLEAAQEPIPRNRRRLG